MENQRARAKSVDIRKKNAEGKQKSFRNEKAGSDNLTASMNGLSK
jgi:hypothetical protein